MENKLRITATDAIVVRMHIELFGRVSTQYRTHIVRSLDVLSSQQWRCNYETSLSYRTSGNNNNNKNYDDTIRIFFCRSFSRLSQTKRENVCLKGEYRNVSGPNLVFETNGPRALHEKKKKNNNSQFELKYLTVILCADHEHFKLDSTCPNISHLHLNACTLTFNEQSPAKITLIWNV